MGRIILQSDYAHNGTFIPNLFIDKYMPVANGAYVKVFLYLLRCLSDTRIEEIDISTIADHFDNTESDIIRALCYWEKVDLLSLKRDSRDNIISITVNDMYTIDNKIQRDIEPPASVEHFSDNNNLVYNNVTDIEYVERLEELKDLHEDQTKLYQFEKPTYSDAQIEQLTNTDEVKAMLSTIELYLQRLIKPMDIQLILYLYESLDFSKELILYLYEYCVSKNKTHPSYVEAVAVSWAKEGVDTLEKAESATVSYKEGYNAVKKAFGLNRALGEIEIVFVNKWTKEYKFSTEIVVEACNRTLLKTQQANFNYANTIIENWHKKGVGSLNDIKALDEKHASEKSAQASQGENSNKHKNSNKYSANNRFNSFPQRAYSKEDYSSLEKKLLHKQD